MFRVEPLKLSPAKKKVKQVYANGFTAQKKIGTSVIVKPPANQSKRAAQNKLLNQKSLRNKLAAAGHVGQIGVCLKRLQTISTEVARKKYLEREEQAKYIVETGVLKTRLEAHFKILNKFLPDLRSVDFQNEEGGNPLEAAISAWSEALNK